MKKILLITSIISLFLSACGSTGVTDGVHSEMNSMNGFTGSYVDAELNEESKDEPEHNENIDSYITLVEEKLVYSCDISIETKRYGTSYDLLHDLFDEYNVIIQSESQSDNDYDWYYDDNEDTATLSAHISCRVPSIKYKDFVAALNDLGDGTKVVSQQTEVQNITQEYYDNTTQIESLKIQEERLLQMLESAETIDDMILIEDRLQEVQYELNSLQTKLMYMNMDVAYSYVNIHLEEVKEFGVSDDDSFFSRLAKEFKSTWEYTLDLLEELFSFVLHLIPFVIIVFIPGLFILRFLLTLLKKIFHIDLVEKLKCNKQNK